MKTPYKITTLLFASVLLLFLAPQKALACVEPHDSVKVTVHYETPGNTDVSILLSNLRLAHGAPNEFCSCGITSVTTLFSTILYVAFVDSGTLNPVPGFDVWDASAPAANAWETVVATGDWSAFVSHVNGAGLNSGNPVELVIRARLAPGYTYMYLDSTLYVTQLGTDAYDNTNQVLGNMHQDVSGLLPNHTLIPEGPGSTYFASLDAALMVSRPELKPKFTLNIFPMPALDRLTVSMADPLIEIQGIEIYDPNGRRLHFQPALNAHRETVDVLQLPAGVYFIRVSTSSGVQTQKFLKTT